MANVIYTQLIRASHASMTRSKSKTKEIETRIKVGLKNGTVFRVR